jgi:hypothetical protein
MVTTLIYLIAAGMVLSTGSVYQYIYGRDVFPVLTILLMTGFIFYESIFKNKKSKITLSALIGLSFVSMVPFFIDFINYVKSFQIIFFHITIITLTFMLGIKNREKIFSAYLNVIVFISLISALYFFSNIFLDITTIFNPFIQMGYQIYPLWTKLDMHSSIFIRNQSIFFEPGIFVVHITIALLLALKKNKHIYSLILSFIAITTFSTTGFVMIGLYLLFQFLYKKHRVLKFRYIFAFLLLIYVAFNKVNIIGQNWNFINQASNVIINKFIQGSSSYMSFAGRYMFFSDASQMFIDSYFLGRGHYASDYLPQIRTVTSSSLAGLIGELGLFGIFCIFLYTRFFKAFKIFSIPITLIWLNGEFMAYSILLLFILAHQSDLFFNNILYRKNKSLAQLPKQIKWAPNG